MYNYGYLGDYLCICTGTYVCVLYCDCIIQTNLRLLIVYTCNYSEADTHIPLKHSVALYEKALDTRDTSFHTPSPAENQAHMCTDARIPPTNISPWYSTCYFNKLTYCQHHSMGTGELSSQENGQLEESRANSYENECVWMNECAVRMVVIQDTTHQHVHRSHLWVHHIQDFLMFCEQAHV